LGRSANVSRSSPLMIAVDEEPVLAGNFASDEMMTGQ
jgi:hypothetical protein